LTSVSNAISLALAVKTKTIILYIAYCGPRQSHLTQIGRIRVVEAAHVIGVDKTFGKAFSIVRYPTAYKPFGLTSSTLDCQECQSNTQKTGQFDLCHTCYEINGGCGNRSHALIRSTAFFKTEFRSFGEEDFCDAPGCLKLLKEEDCAIIVRNASLKMGTIQLG
jgi:hypothetical protein